MFLFGSTSGVQREVTTGSNPSPPPLSIRIMFVTTYTLIYWISCQKSHGAAKIMESFLNTISVFQKQKRITDADAISGLPKLLEVTASIWWQGIKDTITRYQGYMG